MSGYFKNLFTNYITRASSEDPMKRFERQVKSSFISTAVIIAVVFGLIVILVIISTISSIFS